MAVTSFCLSHLCFVGINFHAHSVLSSVIFFVCTFSLSDTEVISSASRKIVDDVVPVQYGTYVQVV